MFSFDIFKKLAHFRLGTPNSAEDFADKFHYQVTTALLLIFMSLLGLRQYVFTPIQCWTPHEWGGAWEEFSENYCWVQNTYFRAINEGPHQYIEDRNNAKINYYQWVPFFIGVQILSFFFPQFLWQVISGHLHQVVRYAGECITLDQEKKKQLIHYLAVEFHVLVETRRQYRQKGVWRHIQRALINMPCFWFGKRSGLSLVSFYFVIKFMYISVDIANLYMMRDFLGFNELAFGWSIMTNLTKYGSTSGWEHSGHFPRVTWCDVPRKVVGNSQTNSIMCVLPLNMINEKVFIFLWFWIVGALIIMSISILLWLFRLCAEKYRRVFVKKFLLLLNTVKPDEKDLARSFVRDYCRLDGVFMLRMLAINVGEIITADVVAAAWIEWKRAMRPNSEISDIDMPPFGSPNVMLGYSKDISKRNKRSSSAHKNNKSKADRDRENLVSKRRSPHPNTPTPITPIATTLPHSLPHQIMHQHDSGHLSASNDDTFSRSVV